VILLVETGLLALGAARKNKEQNYYCFLIVSMFNDGREKKYGL
jgi:hypothetical protein